MTPKLPSVKGTQLVRALKRAGWEEARQESSHVVMARPGSKKLLVVPVHKGQDVKKGILADILKDAGLTPEELGRLL